MSYRAIRKAVNRYAEELVAQVRAGEVEISHCRDLLRRSLTDTHKVTSLHAIETMTCDSMALLRTRLAQES